LFRAEAMAARRTSWLGRPRVEQPWPVRAVAGGSLAAALAVACLIAFGGYTRRVTVQGVVAPTAGVIRVTAPVAGRVETLDVREGEAVTKGQLLYRLALDSVTSAGATQTQIKQLMTAQRGELKAETARQQAIAAKHKAELAVRLADLSREIGQIDRQVEQTGAFVDTLEEQVNRYQALQQQRLVTNRDLLERQQMLAAQRQAMESLKRERIERESAVHASEAELARADQELDTKLADLRRQVNELDRALAETEARRAVYVTASGAGQVTGIVARPGAVVRPGEPLLTITPRAGGLVAHLFAPSESIGFVREGAHVLVRYRAYPYQKFGQHPGTVVAITRAPLGAEEIDRGVPIENQPESRVALYRITVRLDRPTIRVYGHDEPLAIGERLEASVYLERRRIWQWVADPLYAFVHAADAPG
jgi:membrane fusion protein